VLLHAQTAPKPLPREAIGDSSIEQLMLRALEKDRTRRFATAREFADALRAILPTLPATALPVGQESAAAVARTEVDAPTSFAPVAPTIVTMPQQTELVEPPRSFALGSTGGVINGTPTSVVPGFREAVLTKLRLFLQTPVGKLVAIVFFLGFVALVLPAVTTIIKWALIIAFAIFVIVASFKIFLWYRGR
jgi:hypothetical protein